MRLFAPVIVALALSGAASAQPAGTVSLRPEQAAMVGLDGAGRASRVSEAGRADWAPYDVAAARHLTGQAVPDAPVPEATPLPREITAPAVPRGTLRVKFMSIAGRHSLLVIENGYDRAVAYRARMIVSGQTRPTDVCLVIPNQRGYEHWPHPIERIELYDFRFADWRPGEPQPCR